MELSRADVPTNDDLLAELLALHFDIDELMRRRRLTLQRFRDFARDPEVQRTMADWQAFQHLRRAHRAGELQDAAAEALHKAMLDADTPTESRRAAVPLARLATSIARPPRAPAIGSQPSAALGAAGAAPTPHPASPPVNLADLLPTPDLKPREPPPLPIITKASRLATSAGRAPTPAPPTFLANSA